MLRLSLGGLVKIDPEIARFESEINSVIDDLQQRLNGKSQVASYVEVKYDDSKLINRIEALEAKLKELEAIVLKLQIVYENGEPVRFPAGGPMEAEMVDMICNRICTAGFHAGTKSQLRNKIKQALYDFKSNITTIPAVLKNK